MDSPVPRGMSPTGRVLLDVLPVLKHREDVKGARQMTMTAISHIQGRPCGPLLPMRMCCAFRSGRAATGAAASPGGCRAVGFRPCYKTSPVV